MIGRLQGTLIQKNPPQVLVDVRGVGYEVDVSMTTFAALPEVGGATTLWIHTVVREDAWLLFGFATEAERAAFRELIKVSGIGPRIALAVLSGMSSQGLSEAISKQDSALLIRIPGIGKKTAERLLLELKGKLEPVAVAMQAAANPEAADIVRALVALGYSERDATAAARKIPAGTSVSEGVRLALKGFSAR